MAGAKRQHQERRRRRPPLMKHPNRKIIANITPQASQRRRGEVSTVATLTAVFSPQDGQGIFTNAEGIDVVGHGGRLAGGAPEVNAGIFCGRAHMSSTGVRLVNRDSKPAVSQSGLSSGAKGSSASLLLQRSDAPVVAGAAMPGTRAWRRVSRVPARSL